MSVQEIKSVVASLPAEDLVRFQRWLASRESPSVAKKSAHDLESAVETLSAEDLAAFSDWFEEFLEEQWDRQIEEDARAGRLDALARQADEDFAAGRYTVL